MIGASACPDLLINNAGTDEHPAPLWRVPAEKFNRVIGVNVIGVANVIRAFVPAMVAPRKGVIVNLSSGWGRSVSPEVAPYCASKWAIEGLTKALAEELPPGMAAVPLNPGVIDTDMLRQCWADGAAGISQGGSLGAGRRALHPQARAEGQRAVAERGRLRGLKAPGPTPQIIASFGSASAW